MKTYCQLVFVAPFGHVMSISVFGFHVGFTFAHIPPTVIEGAAFAADPLAVESDDAD